MKVKLRTQIKGDPSEVSQKFPGFNLQILCCRYWWLESWEFSELSFPFWRIYHNPNKGASIKSNGRITSLSPEKLYMIAPNTSYSSWLFDYKIPENSFNMEGERVATKEKEEQLFNAGNILHMFIHFNLGVPYDNVTPGIYSFDLTSHMQEKLHIIKEQLYVDFTRFSFYSEMAIQSLVSDLLAALPLDSWNIISKDKRVVDCIKHIQNNLGDNLSNSSLARQSSLATNAFNRLFTDEIGISPQRFVKKTRIDRACVLLHHSNSTIDEIANKTGFADRYHFSRIFKKITGISPASYRKVFNLK